MFNVRTAAQDDEFKKNFDFGSKFTEARIPDPNLTAKRGKVEDNDAAQVVAYLLFCSLVGMSSEELAAEKERALSGASLQASDLNWPELMAKVNKVAASEAGIHVTACLRYDFSCINPNQEYHPYFGVKQLCAITLADAQLAVMEAYNPNIHAHRPPTKPTRKNLACVFFGAITQRNGRRFSKNAGDIDRYFSMVYNSTMPQLVDLYTTILAGLTRVKPGGIDEFPSKATWAGGSECTDGWRDFNWHNLIEDHYYSGIAQYDSMMLPGSADQ